MPPNKSKPATIAQSETTLDAPKRLQAETIAELAATLPSILSKTIKREL